MIQPNSVKLSFSRSAKSYAKHSGLQKELSGYLVRVFASPGIASPKKILDVGCGTGFTSIDAKNRWPSARLLAIDIALPMALEAKKAGVPNATTADASILPFKNSSFDLIVSSLALQWASRDDRLFTELARVLVKGGQLVFSTLGPGTLAELHSAYDKACMECTGKPAIFKRLLGKNNLMEKMAKAGFTDRFAMFRSVVRSYPSVQALFKTLKGTGATLPGRPGNPPRRDILEKTIEFYASEGKGGTIDATYEVFYISGKLA